MRGSYMDHDKGVGSHSHNDVEVATGMKRKGSVPGFIIATS